MQKTLLRQKGASIELSSTWRTEKEELKGLWKAVREKLDTRAFDYFTLVQLYQFNYKGHEDAQGCPLLLPRMRKR